MSANNIYQISNGGGNLNDSILPPSSFIAQSALYSGQGRFNKISRFMAALLSLDCTFPSPIHWLLLGRRRRQYRCTTFILPYIVQWINWNWTRRRRRKRSSNSTAKLCNFTISVQLSHREEEESHCPSVASSLILSSCAHCPEFRRSSTIGHIHLILFLRAQIERIIIFIAFHTPISVDNCTQFVAASAVFRRKKILSMFDSKNPH